MSSKQSINFGCFFDTDGCPVATTDSNGQPIVYVKLSVGYKCAMLGGQLLSMLAAGFLTRSAGLVQAGICGTLILLGLVMSIFASVKLGQAFRTSGTKASAFASMMWFITYVAAYVTTIGSLVDRFQGTQANAIATPGILVWVVSAMGFWALLKSTCGHVRYDDEF